MFSIFDNFFSWYSIVSLVFQFNLRRVAFVNILNNFLFIFNIKKTYLKKLDCNIFSRRFVDVNWKKEFLYRYKRNFIKTLQIFIFCNNFFTKSNDNWILSLLIFLFLIVNYSIAKWNNRFRFHRFNWYIRQFFRWNFSRLTRVWWFSFS